MSELMFAKAGGMNEATARKMIAVIT